jgi:alpha-galactosidase
VKSEVKIVLIGAGSREFSRGLIHDLVLDTQLVNHVPITCVLVDTNQERLSTMMEYSRACLELFDCPVKLEATTDRREALPGADFVLISIATHRMDLWEQDFRVPLSHGFRHVYGENGGPGAMFHALRNLHIVMPVCRDIEALAPEAIVLNFTNPEARILTTILRQTALRAYGLCHGFHDFYEFAARLFNRSSDELDLRTAGMNHLITFYRIADRATGEDLIPEFHRRVRKDIDTLPPLVRFLYETFGIFGLDSDRHVGEYMSFAHELVGNKWEFGVENRKVLSNHDHISNDVAFEAWRKKTDIGSYMAHYAGTSSDDTVVNRENVRPSGELAVPIIGDILLDRGEWRPSVNLLNTEGSISNLAPDGCIEVPATVDGRGIHPEEVGAIPEPLAAMIRPQHTIQTLIAEAYQHKSKHLLYQALILDPVVDSPKRAWLMLEEMLELQKEYLPEFR